MAHAAKARRDLVENTVAHVCRAENPQTTKVVMALSIDGRYSYDS